MGGDGQTVLNLEGTGTTKFLGGLFQFRDPTSSHE